MAAKLSDIKKQYFNGPVGETLFSEPFKDYPLQGNEDVVGTMLKKQFTSLDDRSYVLISAMISEQYVEELLSMLLPGFTVISDGTFMAAQAKIRLLAAFRVIPKALTQAASHVQAVRNAFAHKLEVETYGNLDKKLIGKMKGLYAGRGIKTDAGPDDVKNLFWTMTYMATICLYSYRSTIEEYVRITRSTVFVGKISDDYEARRRLFIAGLARE